MMRNMKKEKQRLLKNSKLKKDLERYFDIETPSRLAERNKPLSDDDEYDTDLDTNLVGLELIVDEKTRQMKDDGLFPEYKQHCREMDVIPNSYFIRHSVDDDFTMRYRYLNSGDCACMGIEMKNSLTFKKLDLEDNGIGPKQIKAMAKMLMKNNTVTDMNFRNNPLGPSGAQTLKSIFLNNAHVTKADFTGCKFGENAGEYLADVIESNVYLKELYLGHNKLGDSSIRLIGRAIEKNVTLEVLDISWNGVGKVGASGIADGLRVNNQLKILNISVNGLGPGGCTLIVNALRQNDTLEEIDLSWNRITDDASDVLARFTSNSRSVKRLKLSHNLFTVEGVYRILKSMKSKLKKTLRHIELDGIDADSELLELAELLRSKYNLTVSLNQPPSRRERSTDALTKSLNSLVIFLEKETLTLKMLYPSLEYDKDEFVSTDDVVERIKIFRDRYEYRELALVEQLRKDGQNPLLQEPLRTPLAGKRRGRVIATPKANKPATDSGKGVRFTATEDDDDDY
ncbi:hypothetical protein KUTeg_013403 [Tegillarca granosa]|uniref:Uncharacterized protein n=1 Tax=Tegillarca granosa TaxID=220873 RepID=A0ABQ9ETK6_TEGGR|nr:hypothetical protein KUTeg_013403 [Tegillarca granosa]